MAEEVTSIKWLLWYSIIKEDWKGDDALWQKKSRV